MHRGRRPTITDALLTSRLRRGAALLAVVTGAAACASFGGARPRFAPMPEAVVFVSPDPVRVILQAIRDSLAPRGLAIQADAPGEGYLETRWYDLAARRTVDQPFTRLDQVVRLRFFVDPTGTRTRVVAESVRRIAWDPSRPERELEVMVPEGDPGRTLLEEVLRGVPRASRDSTAAPERPGS